MSDVDRWLSGDFWVKVLRDTVQWALVALPRVFLVLVLAFGLLKGLDFLVHRLGIQVQANGESNLSQVEHAKRRRTLMGILRKTGHVAIWGVALMLVLRQIGLDVAPLIAGAGIVGLAVGFGAQELVRDVITGFFMLFENQVRVGDVAIVNGQGGLVERIGLRTIVLRDQSGVVHIFQNGKVSTLANMTKEWSAMLFEIGVAYKEDTDVVFDVMREVAESMQEDENYSQKILEPLELFGIESFGDNAVVIKARLKTLPIEQWSVGREYRRRLKKAFDERGIELPFPHRTLYWGEASQPFRLRNESAPETNAPGARVSQPARPSQPGARPSDSGTRPPDSRGRPNEFAAHPNEPPASAPNSSAQREKSTGGAQTIGRR